MFITRIMPVIWLGAAAGCFHRGDMSGGYGLLGVSAFAIIAFAIMDEIFSNNDKRGK